MVSYIGELTEECRRRMCEVLSLYGRPYIPTEPVICMDETSKQLLRETRCPLPTTPGVPLRQDCERTGTCNIFIAVEPLGKWRHVQKIERRTTEDFVGFVCRMQRRAYSEVGKVHLVLDNFNTHLHSSFQEVLGREAAASVRRRIEFHYTRVYPSWLNTAEIEIGIFERQRLTRCAADQATLTAEVAAWQRRRGPIRHRVGIHAQRRGSGAASRLCVVINVTSY